MDTNLQNKKFINKNIEIDVKVSYIENTVWLTLDQIAILFNRDRSVIGKHIKRIMQEKETKTMAVRAKFAHTGPDGKKYEYSYYNLDVVLSIGNRIKSNVVNEFKQWAYSVLEITENNKLFTIK